MGIDKLRYRIRLDPFELHRYLGPVCAHHPRRILIDESPQPSTSCPLLCALQPRGLQFVQHAVKIMKSNVARRVLATFYRPASPRCSAPIRATTPATCSEILRQAPSLPRRTGSSYSISKTVNHAISRSFAPVTLLAAGIKPNSSIARTVTSTCVVAVGGTRISSPKALDRRKVTNQLQVARQRAFHSSGCRETSPRSDEAAKSPEKAAEVLEEGKNKIASGKGPVDFKVTQRTGKGLAAASVVNKRVMDRLPSMPHLHRPNKEELLAAATGFWSRLKVRFKWFSIRSVRPFNMDEIGAFFSWFVLGHVIWIIVGTTTFFSLAIFAVNTVFAQGNPFEFALPLAPG